MRRSIVALVVLVALALPSGAAAATPTDDVYDPPDKRTKNGIPFGGRDLGLAVVAGLTLVGTGLVVRRASRSGWPPAD